ncbi:UrcA family protein [Allopontixanthobacter sp.]|uniref:UrcA family protein n=1 Tax=Allopontixanthobacter sp. TaxID=2906452 RepID=UPI002AB9B22E|nr:UrcA family protein [Allopontixanthobacter sp.]MDZ4308504.1 UrcA family protein [Allopontixanthobacter sp.]
MKSALIALAAAGSALTLMGTAAPALAAQSNDDLVIAYSDLNLETAAGQKALTHRIDKAAKDFCGLNNTVTGSRISRRSNEAKECYRQAKALATKQMARLLDDKRLGG